MTKRMPPTPQMLIRNEPPNLFYRGSSMKGTFKPGDRLSVEKIPFHLIRKGDLIIFRKAIHAENEFVVHRVQNTTPDGLITRGDNCRFSDQKMVNEEMYIGRVIGYDRSGIIHRTSNGWKGEMHAVRCHARHWVFRIARRCSRKPYHLLKKSGIPSRLWQPDIKISYFHTHQGPLIKYIHRDRTVATVWLHNNRGSCRFPYSLLIKK